MRRLERIFANLAGELQDADWYTADWLQRTLDQVEARFDRACDRWRSLYRAALAQRAVQNKVIGDATRSPRDKQQAKRLRAEAESQMELLTAEPGRHPGRFLQLPLLGQRRLPARLQLPAAAAVGLHPRPAGQEDRRRRVS